jgi:hypothetical protein
MARRRKREIWTAETARKEVVLWRASGLTMAEHCRQRGIPPKKFYWWRRRLSEQEEPRDERVDGARLGRGRDHGRPPSAGGDLGAPAWDACRGRERRKTSTSSG